MNIKDAFRYQNFLERLMHHVESEARRTDVLVKTTRTHLRHKANDAATDEVEPVESHADYDIGHVLTLARRLIAEREKLTHAIFKAKTNASYVEPSGLDIDAMTESNKFRQKVAEIMRDVIARAGVQRKRVEEGTAYCFNAEGNQTPYKYDIEVTTETRFDPNAIRSDVRLLLTAADETSSTIDRTLITTGVDYDAPWPVNSTFEEVMANIVAASHAAAE